MRILILGGDGMLGHELVRQWRPKHEVRATLRLPMADYAGYGLFDDGNSFAGIDARAFDSVARVIDEYRPEAVVNTIGVVKQRDAAKQAVPSIEINSLFPHRLAAACRESGARLLHMSTDCVFSGRRGMYGEADVTDAADLYDRSKLLGEVSEAPAITLRTSMIGRELSRKTSLLEWFLAQRGPVKGYRNAIFSGFTTQEMARILEMLITRFPQASGLYHVSSSPISKYDLLQLIRDKLGLSTEILADDSFRCDRSLDSTRFREAFGYSPPTWDAMIEELARTAPGKT
jgi:dTDP-4-dehydrorhamnose reductase